MTQITDNILIQSFLDLRDDFNELDYILTSNLSSLNKFEKVLSKTKKHILIESWQITCNNVQNLKKIYKKYQNELKIYSQKTYEQEFYSINLLESLQKQKEKYYSCIRTQQNLLGSIITSTDWQSPSFNYSLSSMAGRQTGQITANINDYKREGRLDNKEYEKKFLREYIDLPFIYKLFVYPFITNNGMSAFTTVISFLIGENKIKNKVIIGKSCYFENKLMINKLLKDKIIEVDETDTENIFKTINNEKPSVIYFDSFCNNINITTPDLNRIIEYLLENNKNDLYLIIDNTGYATFFQPIKKIFGNKAKINVFIIESLNKYYQLGFDRITGGIIVGYGKDTGKIVDYRENLGTNIADNSVYTLPIPNRKILDKRLLRIGRNTTILVNYLNKLIGEKQTQIDSIKCAVISKQQIFGGGFFSIKFKKNFQKISVYKKYISNVIYWAKKHKINIVEGTSFGLNTTRIYLTATRTDFGTPFVRISPGTENMLQMETLKEVFRNAII